jgi:hypothetical protein
LTAYPDLKVDLPTADLKVDLLSSYPIIRPPDLERGIDAEDGHEKGSEGKEIPPTGAHSPALRRDARGSADIRVRRWPVE